MSGLVSKVEKRLDIIGMSLLQPFREAYAGGELPTESYGSTVG